MLQHMPSWDWVCKPCDLFLRSNLHLLAAAKKHTSLVLSLADNHNAVKELGSKVEMLKHAGSVLALELHKLITTVGDLKCVTNDWRQAAFVPIPNSGNRILLGNDRGSCIQAIVVKVYSSWEEDCSPAAGSTLQGVRWSDKYVGYQRVSNVLGVTTSCATVYIVAHYLIDFCTWGKGYMSTYA